jgi:pilus assembly protein CpaE
VAGEDPLRCVAVSADPALAAALADLLGPLPGVELVAALDAAALSAGAVPRCDVVLVSDEPGQAAPALVRELSARGGPPAVILAAGASTELFAAAMAAGARGLVPLPAPAAQLAQALADAGRSPAPPAMRRQSPALAVAGTTGGCGVTTLALALARLAGGVLIDLAGGYGDLAALLGCRPERTLADLAPLGRGLAGAAVEAVAVQHPCGLRLVAGGGSPALLEAFPPGAGAALVRDARELGVPVVVDAGCPRSGAAWDALRACGRVLVAVTPDLAATAAARALLAETARRGVDADAVALVAARVGRGAELSPRGIARAAGAPVAAVAAEDGGAAALANGRIDLERWPGRRLRRALVPLVDALR